MDEPTLAALRTQLFDHEGLRLKPYKDRGGKVTIGIGRNLSDKGLSESEAYVFLEHDISDAMNELDRWLPWWRKLDPGRQRALVDLCFNMGIGTAKKGLLSFKNTLAAIKAGDWPKARRGLLASKWAKDVQPKRRDRIVALVLNGTDRV
jgi:lysozyme